jgi:aspartate/methionine/tyrosine aminotransferase
MAPPTAAFYVYPEFSGQRGRLAAAGIDTSTQLAAVLLAEHGVATLPGTAFGDDPDRLSLRVATPMLYGSTDDERHRALASEHPEALPWVADSLATVRAALEGVLGDADL